MEHASTDAHAVLRSCPFLARLAKEHGEEYALSIAVSPARAAASRQAASGTDALQDLASSFSLVHGPTGLLPLNNGPLSQQSPTLKPSGCPFHAGGAFSKGAAGPAAANAVVQQAGAVAPPFATISLSNFGKGGHFDGLRRHFNNNNNNKGKPPRQPSQSQHPGPSSNAGKAPHGPSSTGSSGGMSSGSSSSSSAGGLSGPSKPQRPLGEPSISSSNGNASHGMGRGTGKPPGASSTSSSSSSSAPTLGPSGSSSSNTSSWPSSSGSVRGPSPFQQQRLGGSSSSSSNSGHSGSGADSKGGHRQHRHTGSSSSPTGGMTSNSNGSGAALGGGTSPGCPLRKWLGPMAGLVFNQYDKLVCPPPIVAARAALARTAPVQQLRPQALPVKLVAVAAVVAGVNIPCGAVREHFVKFSLGWFIAVHATIPFVAMLRKAVVMPKYAMLVTIASAVAGQMIGARLERMRLSYEEQHGPLVVLPLALPLPSQHSAEQKEAAERQQPVASKRVATSSSSSRAPQHSTPQRGSSSNGDSRNWRQQLLADPEPQAAAGPASSCRSGLPGGLFAHLQSVKA